MNNFFVHRYVKIDWERVEDEVEDVKEEISQCWNSTTVREMADEASIIVRRNAITATGFAAGFLLGMASS